MTESTLTLGLVQHAMGEDLDANRAASLDGIAAAAARGA